MDNLEEARFKLSTLIWNKLLFQIENNSERILEMEEHRGKWRVHYFEFIGKLMSEGWFRLQVSDDEDDTHPNIDTPSLFRWRHQARLERQAEAEREKAEFERSKKE